MLVVVGAGSGEVLSALWCTALYETPSDHTQVYRTFEVTLYPLGQISFSDSAWILSAQVPILNRFFLLCSYIVHRKHLIHSPRTTEKKWLKIKIKRKSIRDKEDKWQRFDLRIMDVSDEGTRTIETEKVIIKNISLKNFLKLEKNRLQISKEHDVLIKK